MASAPAAQKIQPGVSLLHAPDSIYLKFSQPRPALSSAVLNGGYTQADSFLNLKVPAQSSVPLELPQKTLDRYCCNLGLDGLTVGMMTAASLDSLRVHTEKIEDEWLTVLVTTGIDNARRAGDPADYRSLHDDLAATGTINMGVVTSVSLHIETMVEAVMVATEAKAAALQTHGVTSPISGELATGTGTDAIAIFATDRSNALRYVGKHTLFGERLAALTIAAISDSLVYKESGKP